MRFFFCVLPLLAAIAAVTSETRGCKATADCPRFHKCTLNICLMPRQRCAHGRLCAQGQHCCSWSGDPELGSCQPLDVYC
ncbi:unnamed protein product, partial [Mesorhabditis spiculigera]